ncbi:MAG: crotonase/enoyl-CoA hydratase family protein [Actinomycetota bacterium]|nr:crotonase/enoyl-CoA hydratase family protein [Actinomycetota bacterium]
MPLVEVEQDGEVALITINRPEVRNAVNRACAEELAQAFREFEANASAKVAVLSGKEGTFCAGADLAALARAEGNRFEPHGDGPMGPTRMTLAKPAIAAVEGYAVAGGLELALWCDLRVLADDAVLGVFCRRFGVPLVDGGTVRLPRIVGLGRALDLILTGRPVGADEALGMGLANRVAPKGQALASAIELARQIAAFPELCMLQDRASAYEGLHMRLEEALRNEYQHGAVSVRDRMKEMAQDFVEGRGRHGDFA